MTAERVAELEAEAKDLREELRTIEAKYDRKEQVVDELRKMVKSLTAEIGTVSAEKDGSAKRVPELELDVEMLSTKCNELEQANKLTIQAR